MQFEYIGYTIYLLFNVDAIIIYLCLKKTNNIFINTY